MSHYYLKKESTVLLLSPSSSATEFSKFSDGIDDPNGMQWELFGLLVLAWILVYFCLFKGVSTSGKVSIMPHLLLTPYKGSIYITTYLTC